MNTSSSGPWRRGLARVRASIRLIRRQARTVGLSSMLGLLGTLGTLGTFGICGISGISVLSGLSACSSSSDSGGNRADGGGSGGSGSTAPDASSSLSCQEIRTCVWYCPSADSQPCVNDCIGKGTATAQTTFQALVACSAPVCPTSDDATYSYCVNCEQRCFGDGQCIAETEACLGGASVPDLVCDDLCR